MKFDAIRAALEAAVKLGRENYSAIVAKYELERLAAIERLLEGIDVDMGRDASRQPYWYLTVPKCVQVPCPLCGALVTCEVRRDDDIDDTAEACYTAGIEVEKCEDCGKAMCPHCPKTSDDLHGVRCPACQENFDISRAEKQMERS